MAQHYYDRQYRDFSRELSTAHLPIRSFTVTTIVARLAGIAAYAGAVDAITLGVAAADTIVLDRNILSASAPTNVFAQRELKWLVHGHYATSAKKFTHEIPTADPTGRLITGTDFMDLTETNAAAWKTVFESNMVNPEDETDAGVIDFVELVGRNL